MSEYIYSSQGELLVNERGEISLPRREIVRCSDCKWCMAYSKIVYCELFAHRMPNNELDGFCVWGERREA